MFLPRLWHYTLVIVQHEDFLRRMAMLLKVILLFVLKDKVNDFTALLVLIV